MPIVYMQCARESGFSTIYLMPFIPTRKGENKKIKSKLSVIQIYLPLFGRIEKWKEKQIKVENSLPGSEKWDVVLFVERTIGEWN